MLMDNHPNYIPYSPTDKCIEELTHSLWLTTMELEATRVNIQQQIKSRDDRLTRLENLLTEAIIERNEARNKCQTLILDKLLLQQQFHHNHRETTAAPPYSGVSSGVSSSDCEESIVSSPVVETPVQFLPPMKRLPEQGKFLEAVMNAGPLLQNLLLAGPLPHWRHPPPPLDTYQIPSPSLVISIQPVHNCFEINKKRGFADDSDSSTETKYQRISIN